MRRFELAEFVALYRGRTIAEAELVAVSAENSLVRKFFAELLSGSEHRPKDTSDEKHVRALQVVRDE
jgi:hypothetical protein